MIPLEIAADAVQFILLHVGANIETKIESEFKTWLS